MTENCAHDCHLTFQQCDPCRQLHDLVTGFTAFLDGYAIGTELLAAAPGMLADFDRGASVTAQSILDHWQLTTGARRPSPSLDELAQLRQLDECLAIRVVDPGQPGVALDCDLPQGHALDHQDSHTVPGETWCWSMGLPAYQLLDDELAGSEDPEPEPPALATGRLQLTGTGSAQVLDVRP